jgi:hypothetical protein
MEPEEFQKLPIDLPRQPLVNQRPWWIAGLVLTFLILLFAAWSYFAYKKRSALPGEYRKKVGQSYLTGDRMLLASRQQCSR